LRRRDAVKTNMGILDRTLRVAIAAIVVYLVYAGIVTGALALLGAAIAIVFLLTSVLGFCPLYKPFGFSTCGKAR
jgi:hypothetical protein